MAYDPEARQQSNSAMIIGVVALVLMVIGAIAYFSTQNSRAELANTPVVTHTERTIVEQVPGNPAPPVVVHDAAPPVIVREQAPPRVIERNNTVIRERAPAASSPVQAGDTNVNITVPPAPDRETSQPQAGSGSGTTNSDTTTSDSTSTNTSSAP